MSRGFSVEGLLGQFQLARLVQPSSSQRSGQSSSLDKAAAAALLDHRKISCFTNIGGCSTQSLNIK